jgi:hypothetical protein
MGKKKKSLTVYRFWVTNLLSTFLVILLKMNFISTAIPWSCNGFKPVVVSDDKFDFVFSEVLLLNWSYFCFGFSSLLLFLDTPGIVELQSRKK